MATHIMLSFSTQIAQHTEEHPPTPWRVGPCNQVTGAQGHGGGVQLLEVGPTRGRCLGKAFQNMLQVLQENMNRSKGGVGLCIFLNQSITFHNP